MGRVDQLDCGTQRLSEQQSPQVSFLFHGSQIVETAIGANHTLQTKKQTKRLLFPTAGAGEEQPRKADTPWNA